MVQLSRLHHIFFTFRFTFNWLTSDDIEYVNRWRSWERPFKCPFHFYEKQHSLGHLPQCANIIFSGSPTAVHKQRKPRSKHYPLSTSGPDDKIYRVNGRVLSQVIILIAHGHHSVSMIHVCVIVAQLSAGVVCSRWDVPALSVSVTQHIHSSRRSLCFNHASSLHAAMSN